MRQRLQSKIGSNGTPDWTGLVTLLSVSGGLVGFACHMALRITADSEQQRIDLTEITLKDGRLLYFGDALNGPLFENTTSIWSIAGDGISKAEVQKNGCRRHRYPNKRTVTLFKVDCICNKASLACRCGAP